MCNFIYARVALKSSMNVEDQVHAGKQYAEKNGVLVNEIFVDNGFSGLDDNRPSYSKLLETANTGDTIIISSAASMHRNTPSYFELADRYNLVLLDRLEGK